MKWMMRGWKRSGAALPDGMGPDSQCRESQCACVQRTDITAVGPNCHPPNNGRTPFSALSEPLEMVVSGKGGNQIERNPVPESIVACVVCLCVRVLCPVSCALFLSSASTRGFFARSSYSCPLNYSITRSAGAPIPDKSFLCLIAPPPFP